MPRLDRALPFLFAMVCAIAFVGQVHWRPAPFAVEAEIKTDKPALFELRYNRGYTNRQEGIATAIVQKTGEFIRVRFPIETNTIHGLRLVNLGFGRSLELRSLALKPLGGPERSLNAAELAPNSPDPAETRISQGDGLIRVEWNGKEPLVLHLDPGSRVPASRLALLLQWVFMVPLSIGALGLFWTFRRANTSRPNMVAGFDTTRTRAAIVTAFVLAYFVASLFGLNGSSTALWRFYADRQMPTAGVLLGSPQKVRSDEWMLQTPWFFSQAMRTPAFSLTNPSVGSDATPLVTNLPVRHWSTLFRPQMWPFFFLGPERAFAFHWNFKLFGLLLGAFLFFGVVTGRKTLLDLAGAIFVTFSPFMQWWFSTPTALPEMVAMLFFGLWLCAVLLRARARWQMVLAAVALVVVVENFAFCCYPRFQIPLVYLAGALIAGGFLVRRRRVENSAFRVGCLISTAIAISVLTWGWWHDVAEIIRITSALSYPGQIRYTGGDFEWSRLFAPFLEYSMTGDHFPERLENACEAAGFLFLAPFLVAAALRDAIRKRADPLILIPLALAGAVIFFMTVGIPMWAAKMSGWSYVSPGRANLVVGLATAVALARLLAKEKEEMGDRWTLMPLFGGWILFLLFTLKATNVRLGHFESSSTIVATAVFFALVGVCLWTRATLAACLLLVIPQFYTCVQINPLGHGLPGITESPTQIWLAGAHRNRPTGKWIVFGDSFRARVLPDFVKATGADVLGGMRCNPDSEMLAVLDPAGKYRALTNRYAWIHFKKAQAAVPKIEPSEDLAYDIHLPLSTDLLTRLGVSHLLEVDLPGEDVPAGFHVAASHDGCRLLERD